MACEQRADDNCQRRIRPSALLAARRSRRNKGLADVLLAIFHHQSNARSGIDADRDPGIQGSRGGEKFPNPRLGFQYFGFGGERLVRGTPTKKWVSTTPDGDFFVIGYKLILR